MRQTAAPDIASFFKALNARLASFKRENLDVRADRDLGRKREKFMAVLPRVIRGNLGTTGRFLFWREMVHRWIKSVARRLTP
jgi:hypothetical protein